MGGRERADGARNLRHRAREAERRAICRSCSSTRPRAFWARGARRRFSNILSTLVPMFCTEMDGIDSLNDVVIILASNRADLIDPAIIRPGRIDRKIKVNRPDQGRRARNLQNLSRRGPARMIPALVKEAGSVRAAIDQLVDGLIDQQFTHRDENRFPGGDVAQRAQGNALSRRPHQRRDHLPSVSSAPRDSPSSAPSPRCRRRASARAT